MIVIDVQKFLGFVPCSLHEINDLDDPVLVDFSPTPFAQAVIAKDSFDRESATTSAIERQVLSL